MQLYECWICTNLRLLQTHRVKVSAENQVLAKKQIESLYRPVKLLGKPYAVSKAKEQDISS